MNLSKDKKIILLYPTPLSPTHVLYKVLRNKQINRFKNPDLKYFEKNANYYLTDEINYPVKFYREYFSEEIDFLNNINSKNIYKIKLEKTFCPNNQCFFTIIRIYTYLILIILHMKEVRK